ncbi:MAG TPA: molybdopterin dinucleotide binding domain-containing protein, partial [Thermaerobacter sp.]
PDGKAHFVVAQLPEQDVPEGKFRVGTRRGKQFNSMVWDDVDPLTGARRDDVFISREDAERLGLRDGDPVLLRSDYGEYRGRVRISRIRPGNLQVHWPEGNVLIPTGVCDPYCGEPDYNAICELIPLREPATVAEPAHGAPAAP